MLARLCVGKAFRSSVVRGKKLNGKCKSTQPDWKTDIIPARLGKRKHFRKVTASSSKVMTIKQTKTLTCDNESRLHEKEHVLDYHPNFFSQFVQLIRVTTKSTSSSSVLAKSNSKIKPEYRRKIEIKPEYRRKKLCKLNQGSNFCKIHNPVLQQLWQ